MAVDKDAPAERRVEAPGDISGVPDDDSIRRVETYATGKGGDANEDIIRHLETTGEEVGFTWRSIMATIAMGMCYNAYLFTLLIPPAILSFINADLGPDPRFTWITISWNLGGAMLVTAGGRLSDIFGRRYFFIAGSAILILGSIVSATGKTINQMIAGGALFGAGSGFLEMAFGAVQEIVPNRYRHLVIGMFDGSSVISQTMPLISWVIIKYTGNWRICYYIMIGFQTFNLIFVVLFYHPPSYKDKQGDKNPWELVKKFDWLGLFLFIAGCTLFIIGLSWGGSLYPWVSAATLVPIILGAVILMFLGYYEAHFNLPEPLFPPRLFRAKRHFVMPMVVMAIGGMQYYSSATLWTRLSQLLYASDEISKGLYAEVIPLGSVLGGIIVACSKKIGYQKWQVFFAVALQTACVGALSTIDINSPAKASVLTFFVSICSLINILNGMVLVGFGIVYQEDIGTAMGLAGTSRLLAGAVAVAIFSNVTNGKYGDAIGPRVSEAVAGFNLTPDIITRLATAARAGTAAAFAAVPGITPQIQGAAVLANKFAYLDGARLSYQVALAFGLLGCICAVFIPSIDQRKYTAKTVALQRQDKQKLEQEKMVTA